MKMKSIVVLGSTGSIGVQTLEVAEKIPEIRVLGLSARKNIDLLEQQILRFKPQAAAVADPALAKTLRGRINKKYPDIEILEGEEGVLAAASMPEADMVVNALVGRAGLMPVMAAINAGKDIALANKESLVIAGEIIMNAVKGKNVRLIPIDSEHSAVFQCLGNERGKIKTITLTASGGPFRGKSLQDLEAVTPDEALAHPIWSMGPKISIDSATLMNKGLEIIEAYWLFPVEAEQINILIHPQSVVHAMAEFTDGVVLAQLGLPDMRQPIQYALTYPHRMELKWSGLDLAGKSLLFEKPDETVFPCLSLAKAALSAGKSMPAVLNGANEAAVEMFLSGDIGFLKIPEIIEAVMSEHIPPQFFSLEACMEADNWARRRARDIRSKIN